MELQEVHHFDDAASAVVRDRAELGEFAEFQIQAFDITLARHAFDRSVLLFVFRTAAEVPQRDQKAADSVVVINRLVARKGPFRLCLLPEGLVVPAEVPGFGQPDRDHHRSFCGARRQQIQRRLRFLQARGGDSCRDAVMDFLKRHGVSFLSGSHPGCA